MATKSKWQQVVSDLEAAEKLNFDSTLKYLGPTADLVIDADALYLKLLKWAKPPVDEAREPTDEDIAFVSIRHETRMCRMLLNKAVVAAMRGYQGEALTHLRRAIEACAFSVRIGKHHSLSRVWAEGGLDKDGESAKYKAYRDAFQPQDVFPGKNHVDHDPTLVDLKHTFDLCSKLIHGSIFGMAGHFRTARQGGIDFFDMPEDSVVPTFINILGQHGVILLMLGRVLEAHTQDYATWKKEHLNFIERHQRHTAKWLPEIAVRHAARNAKGKQV